MFSVLLVISQFNYEILVFNAGIVELLLPTLGRSFYRLIMIASLLGFM